MPNTFEEASRATEEMFAQENNEDMPLEEGQEEMSDEIGQQEAVEEGPQDLTPEEAAEQNAAQQEQIAKEGAMLEQSTEAAEIAAGMAAQKNEELQKVMAELEALRKQNEQLQGTVTELSNRNEERILEEALTPPTLDINGLAFADEEAQKAALAKFAQDLSAYDRQQIMKEMTPALEYAKRGMRDAEKAEVMAALSQVPELQNIQQMIPQLDRIIENNKWLSSDDMPMDEKYINAYALARGINSIKTPPPQPEEPKEPTAEELLEIYNKNPAFQELVEKQRLDAIKQSQQVPPMSASSGAAGAALNIKEKPQTLEEASRRTREMFGMM
jgi:hypothetical protein